jgi:hypothetical protein
VGSKTAAGITENINSLDPLDRSYLGPFFFGDSSFMQWHGLYYHLLT